MVVTVAVYAKPRSRRGRVGGTYNDALVVAVTARAVDGAANDAIVESLATELGLKPRMLTLARGHSSRFKVIEVVVADDDHDRLVRTIEALRG